MRIKCASYMLLVKSYLSCLFFLPGALGPITGASWFLERSFQLGTCIEGIIICISLCTPIISFSHIMSKYYWLALLNCTKLIFFQIQLKFLAEEMQAINKGLEKVMQELTLSESDGPVSEHFCKVISGWH